MNVKIKKWHCEAFMYFAIIACLFLGIYKLVELQEKADKKFMELIKIKVQNERFRNTNDKQKH